MATTVDNLFNKLSGSFWNAGVTFERTNPVPLEKYSVFQTYEKAADYALTNVVAYPGQPVAVVDSTTKVTQLYFIDQDGKLIQIGAANDTSVGLSAIEKKLSDEISARIAGDEVLSTNIETLSTNLSTDLAIEIQARKDGDETLSNAITAEAEARKENDDYLSAQIDTVSSDLSDAIEEEREARIAGDEALSTQIETLSTNLSTDLSAEIKRATEAEAQVLADAKTYTNEVSTALSTDYVQKIADLSGMLSTAWHFIGTKDAVPTDNTGYTNGDIIIINKKYTDVDGKEATAAVEYAFDGTTWQQLGDESSNVSKYQLKTEIDGLSATVSAEIDHDVEALSTSLSNEVDAKLKAEKEAREAKDDALSTEIENLSTALSTEISALEQSANEELKEVSAVLSTAIEEEREARIAADEKLSSEIEALSTNLSTDLSTEIAERKAADTVISNAVDNKILVQDGDDATAVSVGTMTIHKISEAKYAELLSTDGGIISSDLYIVSSDNLNAHDHAIINVLSGTEDTDAVNVAQLNAAIESANGEVTTLSNYLLSTDGYIDQVSSNLYAHTDAASAYAFEQANNYTSATVSADLYERISAVSAWVTDPVSSGLYAHADAASAEALKEAKDYTDEVSGNLSTALKVTLSATAGTGNILSTYTIKQGGVDVGTIDIPKDKVIHDAKVVKDDGLSTTYLVLSVENVEKELSVEVPTLVNTYYAEDSDTIDMYVTDGSISADGYAISAEVKDSSITTAKLADNAVTNAKIADESVTMAKLSGEFIFDCGDASGYTA